MLVYFYCALSSVVEHHLDVMRAVGSIPTARTMILLYVLVLGVSLIISILFIIFFIAEIVAKFNTDAPFVPAPKEIDEKIIETLKLGNSSIFYDLGCGNARILKKVADKYPGIKAIGVEKSLVPYLLAKFRTRKNRNVEIKMEDIFETDVTNATHIFVYLYPKALEKLLPILEKKVSPGTRMVSCDFEDKNRKADEIIILNNTASRGKRLIIYTF